MPKLTLLAGFLIAASAFAQRPQMTWDGYITGGATLFIQGRNVDPQGRTTGAIDRPRFQFTEPLPASPVTVSVRILRGSGKVEVVEQPTRQNDFSAVVEINNTGSAPENYSLAFFWNAATPPPVGPDRRKESARGIPASVTWKGKVQGEAVIQFRGRSATGAALRGGRVESPESHFNGPLPRRKVTVRLEDVTGRGRVELLEQPGAANNYTATVRIVEEQGNPADYSFTLRWDNAIPSSAPGVTK